MQRIIGSVRSGLLAGVVALAVLASPAAGVAAAAPVLDCVAQPFTWFGPQSLAVGASIEVGTVAAPEPGVQLEVTATDSSPVVVPIRIGGVPVVVGSPVGGGAVTVTNSGTEPVEISSVAVGLDRCRQVASEAVPTTAAPVPPVPDVVDLPETGRMSRRVAAAAAAALLAGSALVVLSRRRVRSNA